MTVTAFSSGVHIKDLKLSYLETSKVLPHSYGNRGTITFEFNNNAFPIDEFLQVSRQFFRALLATPTILVSTGVFLEVLLGKRNKKANHQCP